jgi:uncharacterized protein YuzE
MGIRRRRKKLTSLLSDVDRRIRSTTLRQVRRQAVVPSDVEEEDSTTTPTPPIGSVISETPPDEWAKIIGGNYYPPNKTGGLGQVELFINQNLQLSVGDALYVSGTEVEWSGGSFRPNTSASSTTERTVIQYGTPEWTGRESSRKPNYVDPIPTGSAASIIYTVANKSAITSSISFNFRRRVSSYSATTTTGTIATTANHHFVVGHILDISDLPAPFRDVDGIIKVASVPAANLITFTFSKPISAPISTTTPPTAVYVNACVSKFTAIGSSYISPTTQKVSVWDGLRWVGYSDSLENSIIVGDKVAPAPPTNLSLSSYGYLEKGVTKDESKSAVLINWSAPTQNSTGGALNDLIGYRIWVSTTSENGPWFQKQNFGLETDQTILGLIPETIHYFAVIAFDAEGLDSIKLTGEIETSLGALSVEQPSTPILSPPRLGTVTVKWDGKDVNGAFTPVSALERVEVHASTSSGYTPSETTLKGEIRVPNGIAIVSDLDYNTDYYIRLVAIDVNKKVTTPSPQVTVRVAPLVDADLIAARLNAPLSAWPFADGAVIPGALASGAINASNILGPNVVRQEAIAAGQIGTSQLAANAVTAGQIAANTITSAQIAALTIEAGNIKANTITGDKIIAGTITTEKLQAGELVGFNIKTANSGTRVILNGSNISFFNSQNDYSGSIFGVENFIGDTALSISGPSEAGIEISDIGIDIIATRTNDGFPEDAITAKFGISMTTGGGIFLASDSYVELYSASNQPTLVSGPGGMSMFGRLNADAGLKSLGAYSNSVGSSARDLFITSQGNLGTVSSSRATKDEIQTLSISVNSIFSVEPKSFKYNIDIEEYGRDKAPRTVGFIAEDLDELNLKYFVEYDKDGKVSGIAYSKYVVALQAAVRNLNDRLLALESDVN